MMELVTGGSGSGKSAYAEERISELHRMLCEEKNTDIPLYYIADMIPYGQETEKKIQKHRRQRLGRGFATLEWYLDLPGKLAEDSRECPEDLSGACVLLECVSNLTANEMYEPGGAGMNSVKSIVQGVRILKKKCSHLVVVTNDVFRGSVPDSGEMERYKNNLGMINQALGKTAEQVTEVICGCPVSVKYPDGSETDPAEKTGAAQEEKGQKMILITGGAYQGKLQFAKEKYKFTNWTDGEVCSLDDISSFVVMEHFHKFIRRWLQAGKTQEELTELLVNRALKSKTADSSQMVVISDEIGCGLVPIDAFEREYREAAGRICAAAAEYADEVYRVVCGIGQRLK